MHETTICRCEEVTLETILNRVQAGTCTAKGIKLATRAGMGSCQGRTCRPLIDQLLRNLFPTQTTPALSYRAPVRPTLLSDLAAEALQKKRL